MQLTQLSTDAVSLGHSTQKCSFTWVFTKECSITLGKDRCCIYMRSQDKGSWLLSWWLKLCPEVLWGCPSGRALRATLLLDSCLPLKAYDRVPFGASSLERPAENRCCSTWAFFCSMGCGAWEDFELQRGARQGKLL